MITRKPGESYEDFRDRLKSHFIMPRRNPGLSEVMALNLPLLTAFFPGKENNIRNITECRDSLCDVEGMAYSLTSMNENGGIKMMYVKIPIDSKIWNG